MRKRDLTVLLSALLSFILSVYLWFSGEKEMGQYVSIWVPTMLVYGIFLNTIPKMTDLQLFIIGLFCSLQFCSYVYFTC